MDYASPINYGAWSSTTSFLSATDTTPPATPAPPAVAASLIAVQVTHTLGLASGGTYNLPLDMDHFDVHIGTSSGFTPSAATLAGKLTANGSMVTGTIPAVGTFTTSAYQPGDGVAQAQIKAVWTQPLNTDASTIVNGDHYEIRYRPTGATEWAVTYAGWDQTSVSIIGLNPSTTYEF